MTKHKYICTKCQKTTEVSGEGVQAPWCCGLSMKEYLPVCTTAETAEQARFSDDSEPCDDGRAG